MNRTYLSNRRPVAFQRPPTASVGKWYEIKNLATDTAEVAIFDEIGFWGVTASEFVRDLQGISAKTISLHLNSPGGDVFDGLAILNSLRQHPAAVNVTVDGIAASAASFIAMAGDNVVMAPNSMMMIHDAGGACMGNASDMAEMSSLLEKTSANIANIYAQRAGGTAETWRSAMQQETWYTDQEAVDAGLADSILGADNAAKESTKADNVVTPAVTNAVTEPPEPVAPITEPVESPKADPEPEWDLGAIRSALKEMKL
jgi:ATP-dependent Clp endopeptidase proteolytic subunit ClpP